MYNNACPRVCDVEAFINHIRACSKEECPSELFVKDFGDVKESWDIRREVNKLLFCFRLLFFRHRGPGVFICQNLPVCLARIHIRD